MHYGDFFALIWSHVIHTNDCCCYAIQGQLLSFNVSAICDCKKRKVTKQLIFAYVHGAFFVQRHYVFSLQIIWIGKSAYMPGTAIEAGNKSIFHYCDVIMGTMASQITSLTIVYSSVYLAQFKENIKTLRHWPLCGEFTGDRWIPRKMASYTENISIWWRHHAFSLYRE